MSASSGQSSEMETMQICLSLLLDEETEENRAHTLQTLLKIMKNALDNPQEEKYGHIRKSNKTFSGKVWCHEGARQFMMSAGWVEVDESVVLEDRSQLAGAVAVLEAQISQLTKSPVSPGAHASSWTSREISEKDHLIAEERKKQYEKMKREKEERKRIAAQIKADRQEANQRENRDSHARHLEGHGMTKFGDIGINLTQGGG